MSEDIYQLRLHFDVLRNTYEFGYGIRIYTRHPETDVIHLAQPLTMKLHENSGEIVEPTLKLEKDEMQELMDGLYRMGIRPSGSEVQKVMNDHVEKYHKEEEDDPEDTSDNGGEESGD